MDLARLCNTLGQLASLTGPGDTVAWYGRSVETLKSLREAWPKNAAVRELLLQVYLFRSAALGKLYRFAEGVEDCGAAAELADADRLPEIAVRRLSGLTLLGRHKQAADEAHALHDRASVRPAELCSLAWMHATWIGVARADAKLPLAEREALAERYAAEAVRLLRQAHTAGHFAAGATFDWLEKGQQLQALRGRDDFRALLAEVRHARKMPAKSVPAVGR
jgi:hypothetical protein